MEYINAEEFLKQPKEVQKVFVDWWEPSIGDLFSWVKNDDEYEHDLRKLECCNSDNIVEMTKSFKGIHEGGRIPLLSESQLRKFIEDKKNYKIEVRLTEYRYYDTYDIITGFGEKNNYRNMGDNLLQAYWKVAVQIAEQEAKENAGRR